MDIKQWVNRVKHMSDGQGGSGKSVEEEKPVEIQDKTSTQKDPNGLNK